MDRNVLSIGLWTKNTGNLMSHSAGLSHEELQYIKNLKVGDRLIVWLNQKKTDASPSHTLRVYQPKGNNEKTH